MTTVPYDPVSTHSRPKAAGGEQVFPRGHRAVSTHSRPKAAGKSAHLPNLHNQVSTHSRPKAAGQRNQRKTQHEIVSTHSRPKAAGPSRRGSKKPPARFNSQPPEGGWTLQVELLLFRQGFNSQPPEGGWIRACRNGVGAAGFQLTAARRRLVGRFLQSPVDLAFQRTAARRRLAYSQTACSKLSTCFNSQPPEGGWQCLFRESVHF